jgi:hypothetical protein
MLHRIAICMTLSVTVWAQQIDKPATVQDLADQRDAARAERADKLNVIDGAERILRVKLGPDLGDDPRAEGPFIHLQIMACLVKGDYSRRASKIYADAAEAAATAARELDAKAGVSTAPPAEATEARRNLDEAIAREVELRAKPTLNGVEKAELDGLPAFESQLRETIAIYERIEKSSPVAARSSDMARQMREKEALFRIKVKQADVNTNFYNAQCVDARSQLRGIAQAESDDRVLHQYARLAEGQAVPNVPGNAAAPTTVAGLGTVEKLKEDERTLSDPDAMLKLADHLKHLSGQSK